MSRKPLAEMKAYPPALELRYAAWLQEGMALYPLLRAAARRAETRRDSADSELTRVRSALSELDAATRTHREDEGRPEEDNDE